MDHAISHLTVSTLSSYGMMCYLGLCGLNMLTQHYISIIHCCTPILKRAPEQPICIACSCVSRTNIFLLMQDGSRWSAVLCIYISCLPQNCVHTKQESAKLGSLRQTQTHCSQKRKWIFCWSILLASNLDILDETTWRTLTCMHNRMKGH